MSIEVEFNSIMKTVNDALRKRVDDLDITENEADIIRSEVYDAVAKVFKEDDSWCASSSWYNSSEECGF